jgi:predicted transcriptional regulator YdeE
MAELGRLTLPTVILVGIEDNFVANHNPEEAGDDTIGNLWAQLTRRIADLGVPMHWMIGVTAPTFSGVPNEMRYFAGMVVEELPADLHGMKAFELEGAEYVTYEHHGPMSQVGESIGKFYSDLLPNSGLEFLPRPHLEIYDERFTMDDSSVFRFAAPIAPGQ